MNVLRVFLILYTVAAIWALIVLIAFFVIEFWINFRSAREFRRRVRELRKS